MSATSSPPVDKRVGMSNPEHDVGWTKHVIHGCASSQITPPHYEVEQGQSSHGRLLASDQNAGTPQEDVPQVKLSDSEHDKDLADSL